MLLWLHAFFCCNLEPDLGFLNHFPIYWSPALMGVKHLSENWRTPCFHTGLLLLSYWRAWISLKGLGAHAPKPTLTIHPRSSERGILAFSRKEGKRSLYGGNAVPLTGPFRKTMMLHGFSSTLNNKSWKINCFSASITLFSGKGCQPCWNDSIS